MNYKQLFYFAGKCLALDENTGFKKEFIYHCQNDLVDWEQFVSLCSNHFILQVIFLKLKAHNLLEYVPIEIVEHLNEINELNTNRNKYILKQIRAINQILNDKGIPPTYLKGAGNLLDGLYSNIGERILGDIDFLVSEKNYLLSAELLKKKGYTSVKDTPAYIDIEKSKHYPRLIHPEFESVIEIHRIPVDEKYLGWFNSRIINSKIREPENLPGGYVLSNEHKVIQNFIHSQLSDEGHLLGFVSLKELYDLYLLSKRIPLEKTISKIKEKRKACAYYALTDTILGLNKSLYSKRNFLYWLLLCKNSLNLRSELFYRVLRCTIFIAQRIFKGYIGQFFQAFYSKNKRLYLYKRITNREWYKNHLRLYTRFFKKK